MDKEAGFTPLWPRTFHMSIQFGQVIACLQKINAQQTGFTQLRYTLLFSLLALFQFVKGSFLQKVQ